ncbi:hypothetical protein UFOVP184_25 [uncultured Caudovirales phage]|uniref:Uncharacterized protein n=1 Tax=uncultured Caudovirales phage TaxID=2100421 RepID=A0A6J7WJW5_9CAUD|nr:hypothetical protein UFOVP184_25 [uncultured Caudovirales phage]
MKTTTRWDEYLYMVEARELDSLDKVEIMMELDVFLEAQPSPITESNFEPPVPDVIELLKRIKREYPNDYGEMVTGGVDGLSEKSRANLKGLNI